MAEPALAGGTGAKAASYKSCPNANLKVRSTDLSNANRKVRFTRLANANLELRSAIPDSLPAFDS